MPTLSKYQNYMRMFERDVPEQQRGMGRITGGYEKPRYSHY